MAKIALCCDQVEQLLRTFQPSTVRGMGRFSTSNHIDLFTAMVRLTLQLVLQIAKGTS